MFCRIIFKTVFLCMSGVFLGNMLLFAEYSEINQPEENENSSSLTQEARIANIEDKLIAFEERIEIALNSTNPVTSDENSISRGKSLFVKQCQKCHGAQGRGNGPLAKAIKNIGDLSNPNLWNKSDQELFNRIANGKAPMPSYKRLKKEDRWHLVNYIRTFAPKPAP